MYNKIRFECFVQMVMYWGIHVKRRENFDMKGKVITELLIAIEIAYLCGCFIWITEILPRAEGVLSHIYINCNPFTIGAYLAGITALLSLIFLKKIWMKVIVNSLYVIMITVSGIALMGAFELVDLVMYLPHIFILPVCGFLFYESCKIKPTKRNL